MMDLNFENGNWDENNFRIKAFKSVTKRGHDKKGNNCNQCEYASPQASKLRRHLKTHSGEKSNKCHQCDYESFREDHFRTHLETHSGEKPNKCNQCDFACSDPSSLRRHLCVPLGHI